MKLAYCSGMPKKLFKIPVSDHFDGQKFFSPGVNTLKTMKDIWKWQREGGRAAWPKWVENTAKPVLPKKVVSGELHATFVNHITYLLQFDGLNVLTDPVFSKRVSPFQFAGPKRVRAPGIAMEALPKIDLILLSHNHYDHLDSAAMKALTKRHDPIIVTPLNNAYLLKYARRVIELDWWQSTTLDNGAKVTVVPAQHWSARGFRDRNYSLWGGFIVEAGGLKVYFAGDTGYGPHFKQIREKTGTPNVSILPIGAYEPRWFMKEQHMNPADAVLAHLDLGCKYSLGSHYGCFQLTNEAIDQPLRDLKVALAESQVEASEFLAPETGETVVFRKRS